MITLQYFNGTKWIDVGEWIKEEFAWASLGKDNFNYRTVNENGKVLTDKSQQSADENFEQKKEAAKTSHDRACDLYRSYVGSAKTTKERLRRINKFRCG